jgi:hypothetical protein
MTEKKSAIFSLSFHKNRVQRDNEVKNKQVIKHQKKSAIFFDV